MLHADWVEAIKHSNLQCVRWIFCPGYAGVRGNERADALAGEARIDSTLTLDPPTVRTLVSEHLELTRVDTSHTTSLLKEKGIPRGLVESVICAGLPAASQTSFSWGRFPQPH